jgi:hypothetical protein
MPPYGEFIFGHEYAGDVAAVGSTVDEFRVGDRVVVEAHMGCRRCENCIRGLYTACLNFGNMKRGHRANGFTTNGGLAEYALNHVNTLHRIPEGVSYEEAVVVMTAGSGSSWAAISRSSSACRSRSAAATPRSSFASRSPPPSSCSPSPRSAGQPCGPHVGADRRREEKPYQTVFRTRLARSRRSLVMSGRPSARAVAAISRSAGSPGKSSGN